VLEGIEANVKAAQADSGVRAIVITGSRGKFSGGFDITQLKARTEGRPVRNMSDFNTVLNSIVEAGPKPTVAAIENLALGGGLEVATRAATRSHPGLRRDPALTTARRTSQGARHDAQVQAHQG
jgi:enoyl-CoA hydratase/3-hydroxyacyl-CoA dehydrogenase